MTLGNALLKVGIIVSLLLIAFDIKAQTTDETDGTLDLTYMNSQGYKDGFMMLPFKLQYKIYRFDGLQMGYKGSSAWDNFSNFWYKGVNYSKAQIPQLNQVHVSSFSVTARVQGPCVDKPVVLQVSMGDGNLSGALGNNSIEVLFKVPADCDVSKCKLIGAEVTDVEYSHLDLAVEAIERYIEKHSAKASTNTSGTPTIAKNTDGITPAPHSTVKPNNTANHTTRPQTTANASGRATIAKPTGLTAPTQRLAGNSATRQDANIGSDAAQNPVKTKTDDFWAAKATSDARIEQQSTAVMSSYYAGQALDGAQSRLAAATTLNGNYASADELEQEFGAKYQSIGNEISQIEQAKNDQLSANSDYFFGNNASDRAVGATVVAVGSIINSISAAHDEKKAKEELERSRAEQLAKLEARKKALSIEMRKGLLAQFPDGGFPLSTTKVNTVNLYFFAYQYDEATINGDKPAIYVTNVFPIGEYGDGTWPFKKSIVGQLARLGAGKVTLIGYYTTKEMADNLLETFNNIALKAGFAVTEVNYKGRLSTMGSAATTGDSDFWGTGTKKPAQSAPNPAPATKNEPTKKADDFWIKP